MSTSAKAPSGLVPRGARKVPLVDQPPLGHWQALVAQTVGDLGTEATAYNVLEKLVLTSGVFLDHAQVYGTLKKLSAQEIVRVTDAVVESRRGPAAQVFGLTDKGREAIADTYEHYKALVEFFGSRRKNRPSPKR